MEGAGARERTGGTDQQLGAALLERITADAHRSTPLPVRGQQEQGTDSEPLASVGGRMREQ